MMDELNFGEARSKIDEGKRAEDFHRLQLEKLQQPIEAVQLANASLLFVK